MTYLSKSVVVGLSVLAKPDSHRIRLEARQSKELHQYPRVEREHDANQPKTTESDTPRGAGGLMSWAASKAVGHGSRRRAEARLY